MATFIRRALHVGLKIEKTSMKNAQVHVRFSSAVQRKVVEGTNGEKIVRSPYGEITYPEVPVSEYVWTTLENYSDKDALSNNAQNLRVTCIVKPDKTKKQKYEREELKVFGKLRIVEYEIDVKNLLERVCGVTGRKFTYGQARDSANYVARSLLNMGIRPSEVVALVLPNIPESPIAFFGCIEAGIVVTTVNHMYTADEISKQLISSGARAVITVAEIASTVINAANKHKPDMKIIVIDDSTKPSPNGTIPFADLITKGKTLAPVPTAHWSPDDVAVLPYSSGTTGLPKGVMLTHRNLVSNVEMLKQTVGDLFMPAHGPNQEIIPVILPLYHIYGMSTVMLARMSIGSKLITLPKFTPELYVKVLDENKVTALMLVPPIVMFLSTSKLTSSKHLEHVNNIVSGAAPLSETDVEKFYNKYKVDRSKVKFCQGYGLTECSPVALFEKSGVKYSSIGKPVKGCDVRLVDPITKKDVEVSGQTGELWIRGPHVMKGYLNNQKATDETVANGWLLTGDIAYYDDNLDFYITDRLKELIKVKGFQVAPAELEALLRTHPDVEEAGVVGIPDERYGEIPRAFVVLKSSAAVKPEDLQNFVKGKVTEFKELRGGVKIIDSLPKNPSGKILRAQLKREYC